MALFPRLAPARRHRRQAPKNTARPTVRGSTVQGQAVRASKGSWSGRPTSYAYRWRRCDRSGKHCTNIRRARSRSHRLARADVGHTLRVIVIATNARGSASATSTQTPAVTAHTPTAPSKTAPPPVSGSPGQGQGSGATSGSSSCTTTISSELSTAIANAAGGDTICLNSGSYPGFTTSSAKSSMVTVQPAAGATPTVGAISFQSASNITIKGVTLGGASLGLYTGSINNTYSTHIHFLNNRFTGPMCIDTAGDVNQDTLVDGNSFINVGQGCGEGRITVRGTNTNETHVNGVVISNNIIGNPNGTDTGASDGVNFGASAYGTQIGPGNVFANIHESACGSVHCDAIQQYGGSHTTIIGNFIWHNSTGIMSPDSSDHMTITNNVFDNEDGYYAPIKISGGNGDVITHNTIVGPAGSAGLSIGGANVGTSTNETVRDNIIRDGITDGAGGSGDIIDYNLCARSCGGSHGIAGTGTFVGGSSGWTTATALQLASGSLGIGKASDGTNMGILAKFPN